MKQEVYFLVKLKKRYCQFENLWNIEDLDTGHRQSEDIGSFQELARAADPEVTTEEIVLVMTVPRWRHAEVACHTAKMEKLETYESFDVYDEVKYVGRRLYLDKLDHHGKLEGRREGGESKTLHARRHV